MRSFQLRNLRTYPATTAFLLSLLVPVLYAQIGCSVGASGAVASSAQKEQEALATGSIPASFFGMVVKQPTAQPGVATGSRRLWDSGVTWAALEPARGNFSWRTLDAEVAAAVGAGLQVTLTLGMTPTWAASSPNAPSTYGAGATSMPADLLDWDAYVTAVATRYNGRIGAYEIWNAPESQVYWSGAAAQVGQSMAVLAAHAAAAVHSIDGNARIVSPALSPNGLEDFLLAGGGSAIDVIGVNLGSGTSGGAPEGMAATLQALRSVAAGTSADGKPLWNDQASWVLPAGGLAASLQADYVARALLLNAGYGVGRLSWYAWDEHGARVLALTDASQQATQAAQAFSEVESWISGAQMNGCAASASLLWTCQIVREGKTAWILWSARADLRAISSSSLGTSTMTDLRGVVSSLGEGPVVVGPAPVLLQ